MPFSFGTTLLEDHIISLSSAVTQYFLEMYLNVFQTNHKCIMKYITFYPPPDFSCKSNYMTKGGVDFISWALMESLLCLHRNLWRRLRKICIYNVWKYCRWLKTFKMQRKRIQKCNISLLHDKHKSMLDNIRYSQPHILLLYCHSNQVCHTSTSLLIARNALMQVQTGYRKQGQIPQMTKFCPLTSQHGIIDNNKSTIFKAGWLKRSKIERNDRVKGVVKGRKRRPSDASLKTRFSSPCPISF